MLQEEHAYKLDLTVQEILSLADLAANLAKSDSKQMLPTPNAYQLDLIVLETQSFKGIPASHVQLDSKQILQIPNACRSKDKLCATNGIRSIQLIVSHAVIVHLIQELKIAILHAEVIFVLEDKKLTQTEPAYNAQYTKLFPMIRETA
jgi:hypothetical protein